MIHGKIAEIHWTRGGHGQAHAEENLTVRVDTDELVLDSCLVKVGLAVICQKSVRQPEQESQTVWSVSIIRHGQSS